MNQRSSMLLELYHMVNFSELANQSNHITILYEPQLCDAINVGYTYKDNYFLYKIRTEFKIQRIDTPVSPNTAHHIDA